jgi:nucleotide-binding universal stress UspA family protein
METTGGDMNSNDTRPIIVGVDGRPGSAGALRYAMAEARRRHTSLQVVHVVPVYVSAGPTVPYSELHRIGVEILDQASDTVRGLDPDLEFERVLVHGDRRDGVVRAAEHAQLVVVGRETRHGLDRVLTGTATAGIAAHAPCDVVVVPSFWVAGPTRGQVVVGLKSRHNAHELLAQAFAEASARGAALRVVTAWQLADPYFDRVEARTHAQDWEDEGRKVVGEVTAEWRKAYPGVAVETRIVHGPAARVLLDESEGSDLLVISRRKLALPPYGRLGAVGHDLLRLSDVPLHVVPYVADEVPDEKLVLEEHGVLVK